MAGPVQQTRTVVYELSGLIPDPSGDLQSVRVLPFELVGEAWQHLDEEGEPTYEAWPDAYAYASLVQDVVAPDAFSREGHLVEVTDDERLLVVAPAEVHDRIAAAFEAIAARSHRRAELVVELYRLERDVDGAALDVDALLADGAATLLDRRTERLLVGKTAVRRAEQTHTVVRDWEGEIAQGSSAADPQLEPWSLGALSLLRLEDDPMGGGYTLRYAMRLSQVLDWVRRDPADNAILLGDSGLVQGPGSGLLDQPHVGVCTAAGSGALTPGGSLTTLARVDTEDGPVGVLTRYRLEHVDPDPGPYELGAAHLAVLDASARFWPPMQVPRVPVHAAFPEPGAEGDAAWIETLRFPSADWDGSLADAGLLDEALAAYDGPAFVMAHGSWHVVAASPEAIAACREVVREQLTPAPMAIVDVTVQERTRRPGGGAFIGRVALPVAAAGSALAVVGSAGLALRDYEVNVAQHSSLPDPVVGGYLDGLAVHARAGLDGSVEVEVLLHRLAGRESVDLEATVPGEIDRLTFERLSTHERLMPDGAEHRVAGAFPALSPERTVELVVRVRSL